MVAERKTSSEANSGALDKAQSEVSQRITWIEYNLMLADPTTDIERIRAYSVATVGRTGFEIVIHPNPDLVIMDETDVELEDAMRVGNEFDRWRRYNRFLRRLNGGDQRPILVSEGDSWFQFPVFVEDVIDHLEASYNIACTAAAGDTARNMVRGKVEYGGKEYLSQIWKYRDRVQGFLFSAAGNDIIGQDPPDNVPALLKILKKPGQGASQPHEFVNQAVLASRLSSLRDYYSEVIESIRAYSELKRLPLIFHGYDYPFPFQRSGDTRTPLWVREGARWLAPAFEHYCIGQEFRRPILIMLIDALYEMLHELSGDSRETGIWIVDCRNTLTKRDDWIDEIHATDKGFNRIARKFANIIEQARQVAGAVA